MAKEMRVGFNSGYSGVNSSTILECEDFGYDDWDDCSDDDKYEIAMTECVNLGLEVFYHDEE